LAYINDWVKDINPEEHFYLHCAGGYRSMIAASILQARSYRILLKSKAASTQ
jgi:rhodanese-related sulfurtransferase